MLNDKHIEQEAEYLIEELPNAREVMKNMPSEFWELMVKMYKVGYKHGLCGTWE